MDYDETHAAGEGKRNDEAESQARIHIGRCICVFVYLYSVYLIMLLGRYG